MSHLGKTKRPERRSPRNSLEEIKLDINLDAVVEETRRRKESKRKSFKRRGSDSKKGPRKSGTKKSSLVNLESTTGDKYCDELLERINDGNKKKLEEVYTLKEKLGEGAFAKVYLAIHKDSGRKVALKIMSLDIKSIEEEVERKQKKMLGSEKDLVKLKKKKVYRKLALLIKSIEKEIDVMKKVASLPNKDKKSLVSISDVMANPQQIVFAMDILSGGELFERIAEKGEFSEKDAAAIMYKIMKGIKVLHSNKIVHRDLKPENIVFENGEDDSAIKITDFGLAFEYGKPDLFEKSTVGSPAYIAPEILTLKYYSYSGDIWAMGCILFILLVGGPPFSGKGNKELFDQIKSGIYKYPADCEISEDAKDLIAGMLKVDPKSRLTAVEVLKHPWMKKATSANLLKSFNNLKAFNARRRMKKWALARVVNNKTTQSKKVRELLLNTSREDGFTGEELNSLRDYLMDSKDKHGEVSYEQFSIVFTKLGMGDLPTRQIFDLFSKGKDSCEPAVILVVLSTNAKNWKGQDVLKYCFDIYDNQGEGKISKGDVKKILKVVIGEDRFAKMSSGLNSIFNSVWRKKPKVSFKDFKNTVIKQGGELKFKQRVWNPMATTVKSMSKMGYRGASRLGTNISMVSGIRSQRTLTIKFHHEDSSISRQGSYVSSNGMAKLRRRTSKAISTDTYRVVRVGTSSSNFTSVDPTQEDGENTSVNQSFFSNEDRSEMLKQLRRMSKGTADPNTPVPQKKVRSKLLNFPKFMRSKQKSKKLAPRRTTNMTSKQFSFNSMSDHGSKVSRPSYHGRERRAKLIRRPPPSTRRLEGISPNLFKDDRPTETEYDISVEGKRVVSDKLKHHRKSKRYEFFQNVSDPKASLMSRYKKRMNNSTVPPTTDDSSADSLYTESSED